MSKIEIGRFSNLLRREFGMKGVASVASELSPEISPTIQLEGPTAEWDFLKQVRGCRCAFNLPPNVAGQSRFRLVNLPGSGVIAVIKLLSINPNPIATLQINRGQVFGGLTDSRVTVVPDLRWGAVGATTTTMQFSSDNATAAGPAGDLIAVSAILANTEFTYGEEIVLIPGTSLDWGTAEQNIRLRTFVAWTERQLPALEL